MKAIENALVLEEIKKSNGFDELRNKIELPEPYDDRGYFLVYYSEADYKEALTDIVSFIDDGMRIYYDRRLEYGDAWRRNFVAKCKSLHCRCVVFYLSRNALNDETFSALCKIVHTHNIPYVSINLPHGDLIESGEQMINSVGENLCAVDYSVVRKLFANEITYIPGTFSHEEKERLLEKAHCKPIFHFSVKNGYAVLDHIRDITEEEVIVPEKVLLADEEYIVKEIAPSAFSGCASLKKITLPNTIEKIGVGRLKGWESSGRVFNGCKSLEEIVFPPSVKVLATGCFFGCTSLKRLILNDGLEFEGSADALFALESYSNSEGMDLHYDMDSLPETEEITLDYLRLPDTVRRISKKKFIVFTEGGWKELRIPQANKIAGYTNDRIEGEYVVEKGTDPAFLRGLLRLESVRFAQDWECDFLYPDLVRCRNLKRAVLSPNIKFLTGSFEKCSSLEEVVLPEHLEGIEEGTFEECVSLCEITLPKEVRFVDSEAFKGCDNLRTLTVESTHRKLLKRAQPFYMRKTNVFSEKLSYALNCIFKLPLLWIIHPIKMYRKTHQKSFLAKSNICTVYTRKKMRIPYFKRIVSERKGFYKYKRI